MHLKYIIAHNSDQKLKIGDFKYLENPLLIKSFGKFDSHLANNKIFNEYSFLFGLVDDLESKGITDGLITIAQYRRFVSNKPIGVVSKNLDWANVIPPSNIQTFDIDSLVKPNSGQNFLVGSFVDAMSYLYNYSKCHYTRDILRFTSNLIDGEILTNDDALDFLNYKWLVPSPSCGTFPISHFIKIINILKESARLYWINGFLMYNDPYQCRTISFLLERLNSFLLLKTMLNIGVNVENCIGRTIMLSDSEKINVGYVHD